VEALGDAAFEPAQDAAGGEDRVVAEAKEAVESTETAIVETGRSQDGSWGDVWKKPLLFEPAADGGLKPEEVMAELPDSAGWSGRVNGIHVYVEMVVTGSEVM
jgi:hypothetical protein